MTAHPRLVALVTQEQKPDFLTVLKDFREKLASQSGLKEDQKLLDLLTSCDAAIAKAEGMQS